MSFLPLEIKNLVKNYGSSCAVDQVSFDVRPGEIFGLLGPNGAGKTSIISCLVTLQNPTEGEISIFGIDPQKDPVSAKKRLGFVPQEVINHGYFDVYEILQFHSGYFGRWKNKERIDFLLERLGLWEHRHKKVKALSGGMKRRLLIAKALVHEPKLLLLDEPTAGVDIELRSSLWEFVQEIKKQGVSILLTTHYLEEAEHLCDRVGILQKGKLRTVGETKKLIEKMTKRKVTLKLNVQKEITHPQLISHEDSQWQFLVESDKGVGQLLGELGLNTQALVDVRVEEGSLEDAFLHVLGSAHES